MTNSKKDTENLWSLYVNALETWKKTHESWQKAGQYALQQYSKAMNLALKESDLEQIKKYNDAWANTWNDVGQNPFKWYLKAWENMWKESGFVSSRTYVERWMNLWKESSEDVFKKYTELLKQYENH